MQSNPAPPIGHSQTDTSSSLFSSVLLLILGLVIVVILSMAIKNNVDEWYTWTRLEHQGRQVQGKPIELVNRRGWRNLVLYEYKVLGKDEIFRTYRRLERVPSAFFNQLQGAHRPGYREITMTVFYLPENPAVARLTAKVSPIEVIVKSLVGIVGLCILSLIPLGAIWKVTEGLQRGPLDKTQERMIFIGIGIVIALLLVFIAIPPSEGAMMEGIVSIHT